MTKPFVKLFQTINGYYFFDVNRNQLKEIEKESFFQLKKYVERDDAKYTSAELLHLEKEGYLSSHRPLKLEHNLNSVAKIIMDKNMFQIVLQVTQACNLTCIYCPYANTTTHNLSRHHSNEVMSQETAKRALDYFAAHSEDSDEIIVTFYGGEPLISFDLVKWCVNYSKELFSEKNLLFFITTNATLLTDEMIDFFAENHFRITFSLDGPKEIHDRHRLSVSKKPTYDIVMERLSKTIKRYGINRSSEISINMVLNPEDPLEDTIKWLDHPLFRKILVNAALIENDMIEKKFDNYAAFNEKFTYLLTLALLDYLNIVKGLKVSPIAANAAQSYIDEYSELYADEGMMGDVTAPSGPCIPGGKKLFVSTDGSIFPCEKVNELSNVMKIGNVFDGIDTNKALAQLNLSQLTEKMCKNCWAIRHCCVCQRNADGIDNLNGPMKNYHCREGIDLFQRTIRINLLIKEYKTAYKYVPEHIRGSLCCYNNSKELIKVLDDRCDPLLPQEAIIIVVGSLFKGIDATAIVNKMFEYFSEEGYHVRIVSTTRSNESENVTCLPIDDFISCDTDSAVLRINQFFTFHQISFHPDIVILQLPDEGLQRINNKVENGFGVKTYMLGQALNIDYALMLSPILGLSDESYQEMSNQAQSRFGFSYDAICLAPKYIALSQQQDSKKIPYLTVSSEMLAEEVDALICSNDGSIRYGIAQDDWIKQTVTEIIDQLSG